LTLSPQATAESRSKALSDLELEFAVQEMERVLLALSGTEADRSDFKSHGNDLYSLSVALDADENESISASSTRGLKLLAVGQQGLLPSNPRTLSGAVLRNTTAILNFWWAVQNSSLTTVVANTTLTVKGAGRRFLSLEDENLTYPPRKLTLFWEGKNQRLGLEGIYTTKVKVAGGGSRATSFLVR
jgi:hypothetical protein